MIIFTKVQKTNQYIEKVLTPLKQKLLPYLSSNVLFAETEHTPQMIYSQEKLTSYSPHLFQGENVVAVCALGSPLSFLQTLKDLKMTVAKQFIYPDHYFYKPQDIEEILKCADQYKAKIITTEKDIVKINHWSLDPRIYYLSMSLNFMRGENEVKSMMRNKLKI